MSLFVSESVFTVIGAIGTAVMWIISRVQFSSVEYDEGVSEWANYGMSSFVLLSFSVLGVFLAVTVISAAINHKMYLARVALCPVGAAAILLITSAYAMTANNSALPIAMYMHIMALFETMMLSARGIIDDFRLYKGLLYESEQKKNSRKKNRRVK